MGLINLWTQVRRQLRRENGGTGNTEGWATGVIKIATNRTGSTIPLNTLVKLLGTYNDARVTPCTSATDVALGVVVGYWATDDPYTLILADAPDAKTIAVLTHGTGRVILAGTATRGQFAFPSTTSGAASSSATVGTGAFGIFQSSGTVGNTALVQLTGTQGAGTGGGASFGTPGLTLGTANAAGAATTAVRTDATILAFDATTPAASPLGGAGAVGAAAVAARRDHVHAVTGALDALSDVAAPSPASGDLLQWNGSNWVNLSPGATTFIWRPLMSGQVPTAGAEDVPSSYVQMTTPRTTTSATLEDITGATTTITLTHEAYVAAWMTCEVEADGTTDMGMALNIDGTDESEVTIHLSGLIEAGNVSVLYRSDNKLAAGTYTVKGRFRRINGSPKIPGVNRADLFVAGMMAERGSEVIVDSGNGEAIMAYSPA